MKKNLRIVSAAAAALLAVAPVAASAVSVSAADTNVVVTPGTGSTTTTPANKTELKLSLKVNNAAALKDGDSANLVNTSLNTNVGTARLGSNGVAYVLTQADYTSLKSGNKLTAANAKEKAVKTLNTYEKDSTTPNKYVVVAFDVYVTDLDANKVNTDLGTINGLGNLSVSYLASDAFSVTDSKLEGAPYYTNSKNEVITSAKATLTENTVSNILTQIKGAVTANPGSSKNSETSKTTEADIKAQLTALGIQVDKDGKFKAPANAFTITYTTNFLNGKSISIPVEITAQPEALTPDTTSPVISLVTPNDPDFKPEGKNYSYTKEVPVGDKLTAKDIADKFKAQISTNVTDTIPVKVESSDLNTATHGDKKVVLSATNPAGKTSKVTVTVHVGDKDATYRTVRVDEAKIVTIDGNKVTETSETVKKGQDVATYGNAVTANGKSYYSIKNNKFVETSAFEKKAEVEDGKQRAYNKKYAKLYTKTGENKVEAGKLLDWKIGSGHDLSKHVYEFNGNKYYKIVGNSIYAGKFVRVENFSNARVKKTVKVRSRVYNSNKKVVKKHGKATYINKGRVVTVYGEKNGMFNIGGGKYLLKQNF